MKRLFRGVVAGLAAIGLLVIVVTSTPLVRWWGTQLAGEWNDPKGEVLIVLAGSILDNGMIGGSSYWRAVYAALVWNEGGFREMVVSGGGSNSTPIAESMRRFIEYLGVPREAIRTETRSMNTRENALYTAALLKGTSGRKVLLTSDFHMFRARRTFQKAGLAVIPRPFPDVRKRAAFWKGRWTSFLDLSEESAKIVYYWARGWI